MNVFFHCTFAWLCVDFSCKTAFISYHVMSAKTRVLQCFCLLFDWTEFWESSTLLNRESWLAYDDFREKTWLDHGTRTIFLPKRLHSTKSYFIKAIDHTFYGFTGVITHLGCWENTQKACKSLAFGSWFTSFSRVLPTSRVGYHAGKPIESVVYCLNKPHRNSRIRQNKLLEYHIVCWSDLSAIRNTCGEKTTTLEFYIYILTFKYI